MKLSGNTILITGGTSGIGLGLAERLLELGNTVIICGRRKDRLERIHATHPEIITNVCDVAAERDRMALSEWAEKRYGSLNVLVNNAGVQLAADLRTPMETQPLRQEVETNLVAPIHLATLFAPLLLRQREGAIINITSGLAFAPIARMSVYCATKAALHSFSLSLRHQMKSTSVRVFEIAPPSVDSELGYQHRDDHSLSHGGMPVAEFVAHALDAVERDEFEAPVGPAKGMREHPDELFARMNH